MPNVTMYTTAVCPYCIRAKQILQSRGVERIDEIRIDMQPDERIKMMQWFADWCNGQASGLKKTSVITLKKVLND